MMDLVPVNFIDRIYLDMDPPLPWTVHAEVLLPADPPARVIAAAAWAVVARHPLLRAGVDEFRRSWLIHRELEPSLTIEPEPLRGLWPETRERLVSEAFPLQPGPLVKFYAFKGSSTTRLLVVGHHAAIDGVALCEVLQSWVRACWRATDMEEDESWRTAHFLLAPSPGAAVVDATISRLRTLARPTPQRVVHGRGSASGHYGIAYRSLGTELSHGLRHRSGPTANDVLVTAVALAIITWNRSHGGDPLPITIGVPVNLRPPRSWSTGVCNASIPWPVRIKHDDPAGVLVDVFDELRRVRLGIYSREVRALLTYVHERDGPPLWMRHGLAAMTTIVSTVPAADAAWSTEGQVPDLLPLWGGAPAPSTMGITFAVMLGEQSTRLSVRYMRSRFSTEDVEQLLSGVEGFTRAFCFDRT